MENQTEVIPFNEGKLKLKNIYNKVFNNTTDKSNDINRLIFNAKNIQLDIPSFKTITNTQSQTPGNLNNRKILIPHIINNKKNDTINTDILHLNSTLNQNYTFNINQMNNNSNIKSIETSLNNEKAAKDKENILTTEKKENSKKNRLIYNKKNNNNTIKNNNGKKEVLLQKKNNDNGQNFELMIKHFKIHIKNSGHIDKSLKNYNELKKNYIEHVKNQKILKKLDKKNLDKNRFINSNYRKFIFGRRTINGVPYIYDISSTYMNKYQNKSEHNRHEILIEEISKLRAYLLKFKTENYTDIVKDFLIKHNMPNINNYTNYQLMQFAHFVCQEDIYKVNSLLKPYMHIKDMIHDILENSENLNNKFTTFKFNSSIKNLLNNIKTSKSQPVLFSSQKIHSNRNIKRKNIKFYISELDYPVNKNEPKDKTKNISNASKDDGGTDQKSIKDSEEKNLEEEKKVLENNNKDFNSYTKKRKEILRNIGISSKYVFKNIEKRDTYFSPLFNTKTFQHNYDKNTKKIKLPKISNDINTFYKPNKHLLSPDKDYSLNFDLLFKDVTNELNHFQSNYERKFDVDVPRESIQNNLFHSKSSENLNQQKILRNKKLLENNRLFFGKKNIKADFEEIQRKHKLTEYIALIKAKNHIKDKIFNENVINY